MRKIWLCLMLLLAACQGLPRPLAPSDPGLAAVSTIPSTQTLSAGLYPTPSPVMPAPSASAALGGEPVVTATPVSSAAYQVRFHPDGGLFVGDLVSVEVVPPQGASTDGRLVRVALGPPPGVRLGEAPFEPAGLIQRTQATLQWVWNTANLPAGEYELTFSVEPDSPLWVETVTLLPRGQRPLDEEQAAWTVTESDCCLIYAIRNTAAQRDLPVLLPMLDEQADRASRKMGIPLLEPIRVVLLPRVAGHGGFASQDVVISYLDRNYAGGDTAIIFHHELIHLLDARLGGAFRPSMLIEGLAVYQSGGHFKPEPLIPRAAALLPPEPGCVPAVPERPELPSPTAGAEACGLDRYIPLAALTDQFYLQQHEISYLEAGALVEFMVQTWGWGAFSDFYRDIQAPEKQASPTVGEFSSDPPPVDAALQRHFGLSLEQLEAQYLSALQEQRLASEHVFDVRLVIRYYDAMRRYQQLLHPSAYFLNAWLPDSEAMRERKIVTDAMRRPSQPENLALETLLVAANGHLQAGEYSQSDRLLDAVQAVLDGYEQQGQGAFQRDPLAMDYFALVNTLLADGYQPEEIQVKETVAQVRVSETGPQIIEQSYLRTQDGWILMTSAGMATDELGWRSR